MESRAKLLGHPIHQMLIPLPLGLLTASVAFDAARRITGERSWQTVADATLGAGLATGFVAAPFGLIDWLAIPFGTRAKRVGALHALGNLTAIALYGMSWTMRRDHPERDDATPFALALAGLGVSSVAAWFGGELVDRLGVGVDPGANLDAPSSLTEPPPMPSHDEPTGWPPLRAVEPAESAVH